MKMTNDGLIAAAARTYAKGFTPIARVYEQDNSMCFVSAVVYDALGYLPDHPYADFQRLLGCSRGFEAGVSTGFIGITASECDDPDTQAGLELGLRARKEFLCTS